MRPKKAIWRNLPILSDCRIGDKISRSVKKAFSTPINMT